MDRIVICVLITISIALPGLLLAGAEIPTQEPSGKERVNQVLDSDGGIYVYKDHQGNVTKTTVLPNGKRMITVQPPQRQDFNIRPPLLLHNQIV